MFPAYTFNPGINPGQPMYTTPQTNSLYNQMPNLTPGYPTQPAYGVQNNIASPQTPRPSLPGRPVNDINEVMASEVPMDGSSSIFPLQNGSRIYVKSWNSDGTIKTLTYVQEEQSVTKSESESVSISDLINRRFDSLEELLIDPKTNVTEVKRK